MQSENLQVSLIVPSDLVIIENHCHYHDQDMIIKFNRMETGFQMYFSTILARS